MNEQKSTGAYADAQPRDEEKLKPWSPLAPRHKGQTALAANIEAVKAVVSCADVASDESMLYASGEHLRGVCPLPEHDGKSPSFYCYSEQGFYSRWHCHRCNLGGDVLDLYGLMYGLEHNVAFCVQAISERFGIKLWRAAEFENPFERRVRLAKREAQKRLERVFLERMFERSIMPLINAIEDKSERSEELKKALAASGLDKPVRSWA